MNAESVSAAGCAAFLLPEQPTNVKATAAMINADFFIIVLGFMGFMGFMGLLGVMGDLGRLGGVGTGYFGVEDFMRSVNSGSPTTHTTSPGCNDTLGSGWMKSSPRFIFTIIE